MQDSDAHQEGKTPSLPLTEKNLDLASSKRPAERPQRTMVSELYPWPLPQGLIDDEEDTYGASDDGEDFETLDDGLILKLPEQDPALKAAVERLGIKARETSRRLAILPTASRNEALTSIHKEMASQEEAILRANQLDVADARAAGLPQTLINQLDISPGEKFGSMLRGIVDVRAMDDPVGAVDRAILLDDGLALMRSSCPIGVVLAVFESRPEDLTNITSLALKSGNAIILKGGNEASRTIATLAAAIRKGLEFTAVPMRSVQVVVCDNKSRSEKIFRYLLGLDKYIDLVMPRGSQELVREVKRQTQIAVLGYANGICTAYLRADCPVDIATRVIYDSKVCNPTAGNSIETLLVDTDALAIGGVFEHAAKELIKAGVIFYCDILTKPAALHVARLVEAEAAEDEKRKAALENRDEAKLPSRVLQVRDAEDHHYKTEFLSHKLALKAIVQRRGVPADRIADLAIRHINEHSSHHTDVILTKDEGIATRFLGAVDSAGVYWNVSTRMADGHRYGFGAEVGISTNKVHSRGPVGLEGLTIYKWVLCGQGHCAADYDSGRGKMKHTPIRASNLDDLPAAISNDIRRFLQNKSL